jgi:hypothetical protein
VFTGGPNKSGHDGIVWAGLGLAFVAGLDDY